ncbi:alpha/beta hydrolase [Tumidithrix elongata RA019]|uniref:Alpha/beta hydrolase n=1 Tax=Tumidithrix elongata BACA0141 TaxID=2716417 RepID=A0AAW9PZS3_9CYAN|nr:alpha/beta hydrolase [Tumidithrix elongata RA019]
MSSQNLSLQNLSVLCLHGHPGSGAAMTVFVEHLNNRGLKILAPDLRGYGKSKNRQPFSMQVHVEDLSDLLKKQQGKYIILGWSLGGILALELALQASRSATDSDPLATGQLVGLILIATAARPQSSLPSVPWWEYANTALAVLSKLVFPHWHWATERIGKRSLLKYLIQQHTPFAYDRIAHEGASAFLQTSRSATQALSAALRQGYDRRQDLEQIAIPCLMLAGECDRHITAASSYDTASRLPNCEYICYPQTAHLLPWEIPDRVLTDIDRWLGKHFAP